MRVASWNPEEFAPEILSNCMERIEKAAIVVRDAARAKMTGFKYTWKEHGPYKTGAYRGQIWTARDYDALKATIRVTKKKETGIGAGVGFKAAKDMNVWILAGQFKTWYAIQVEFGRGEWKGKPHPFLRPAFNESMGKIKSIIENG
jgi:HK97 gp10 family phage protein